MSIAGVIAGVTLRSSDGGRQWCLDDLHAAAVALGHSAQGRTVTAFMASALGYHLVASDEVGAWSMTLELSGETYGTPLVALAFATWVHRDFAEQVHTALRHAGAPDPVDPAFARFRASYQHASQGD
jgi:hypothetical protein